MGMARPEYPSQEDLRSGSSRRCPETTRCISVRRVCQYSSQCVCDLGVNGPALCNFQSCGICTAVKSSFSSFAFGEPAHVGRYGEGIYSYLDPSIADRHATSCTSSPYRVMIACDVFVTPEVAKRQSDSDMNDGERVFIKDARAIIPGYVIAYTK